MDLNVFFLKVEKNNGGCFKCFIFWNILFRYQLQLSFSSKIYYFQPSELRQDDPDFFSFKNVIFPKKLN